MRLPQRVELLAEEDVGLGLVREDELELGLVGRVGERVGEDLVERGAAEVLEASGEAERGTDVHAAAAADERDLVEFVH